MEQLLSRTLNDVKFFAIADGGIWEIERDYKTVLDEAGKMLNSSISHLSSVPPGEMNLILKEHIVHLYAGIFHMIAQNSSAGEKLDPEGNFRWAPVKKRLAAIKSDLRILKEYMEVHSCKNPGLRFSLQNGVENLDQAADCVNHVLVTHSNRAKI